MADYATPTDTVPPRAGATKVDLDRARLIADIPWVDDDDNIITRRSFEIDLDSSVHPDLVRTKIKQAIRDVGEYVKKIVPLP